MTVYLDAGHGGIDPNTKKYTTAPNKMFIHKKGNFHNGRAFYEGVFNRNITIELAQKLYDNKVPYQFLHHPYLDIPLKQRISKLNLSLQSNPGILISNHSNASPSHNARGWEIYTSPGKNNSDKLGQLIYLNTRKLLPDLKYRPDFTDGDFDKEARFYMTQRANCAAVLIENLFFDNYEDAKLLIDPFVVEQLAEAQYKGIMEYFGSFS